MVDADSAHTVAAGNGVVRRLAVAPNGQFVAAFTDDGRLVVWVADFTKNLSEFSTESDSPPDQLAWCGTDSVVMAWPVSALDCVHSCLAFLSSLRGKMWRNPQQLRNVHRTCSCWWAHTATGSTSTWTNEPC